MKDVQKDIAEVMGSSHVQCSTNWAIKPTELGASNFVSS